MKHSYFSFFTLSFFILLLSSCEAPYLADDDPSTPSATTPANLTLSVFQLEQTPFTDITRTAPADACTRLNFALYDASGTKVKQINQTSSDPDFGNASFQLEPGTYRLVVVAHSSNGNPTMTDPGKIQFTNAQGYSDTFLYSEMITIGQEPLTLSLTLNRIVALCRFIITDDIPATVAKMRFYYTGGSGAFDAATGYGSVNSKQDLKFDVTAGQKQFDLYTFPYKSTESTIHLVVTALDASGTELTQRTFDVPLEKNKISSLSGAFFTATPSHPSSASVTLNTTWSAETLLTY